MDIGQLLVVGHLLGVALGAGGAYLSDYFFFQAIKNKHISQTELRFLGLSSQVVWVGLSILIISGLGLFLLDIDKYLDSTKFLAKMSIVGVIFLNGLFFEFIHFGHLRFHVGKRFYSIEKFLERSPALVGSGVISVVSWTFALVLGSLPSLPYSYVEIMGFYLVVILSVILVTLVYLKIKNRLGKYS